MTEERPKQIVVRDILLTSANFNFENQMRVVNDWKRPFDMWPLQYGSVILGGAAALSGFYINGFFRRKLKLLSVGSIMSYTGVMFGASAMTYMCNKHYIVRDILVNMQSCRICTELKIIMIQEGFGVLYPIILSCLSNLAVASGIGYKVPHILDVKEMTRFFFSVVKPIIPKLTLLALLQVGVSSFVAYEQFRALEKIQFMRSVDYHNKNVQQQYDTNL